MNYNVYVWDYPQDDAELRIVSPLSWVAVRDFLRGFCLKLPIYALAIECI